MIRYAGVNDYEIVMDMMINFANAAPFSAFHNPEYNANYITNLITGFMKKGCILIAEKDDKAVGKKLKDKGIIEAFTLTNMVQSPDFDLKKRGWREVETNYVYEG